MRSSITKVTLALLALAALPPIAAAQSPDLYSAMHWRQIGPTRAGRARAVTGVPSQPNVAYIGGLSKAFVFGLLAGEAIARRAGKSS